MQPDSAIRSRQIRDSDLVEVIDLLACGFRTRPHRYWQRALAQLASHPTPPGLPRYGYLLEHKDRPVGVVLLISSAASESEETGLQCDLSSWYVKPEYRRHAALLMSKATRHKNVTYVNISPAQHTRSLIEAEGFSRYSNGQFINIPALTRKRGEKRARVFALDAVSDAPMHERAILLDHRSYGCISLWCKASDGTYPFVFVRRWVNGVVPCAQLIYCRQIEDFVRFAPPLGRYLAQRGRPLVLIDSNGPIAGLTGKYLDDRIPKYFKGTAPPRLGNLAYTEAAMFGL